jgi:hypothetical protein
MATRKSIKPDSKTTIKEEIKKDTPKKFEPEDLISCTSITTGELIMVGAKTDQTYTWADINDTTEIEYQDLNYAVRRGSGFVFKPRFVINDEDFLDLFPKIREVYEGLYSVADLKEILQLAPNQIASVVKGLPTGAFESLKVIVMTEIDRGTYTDIRKIKIFDELFETNMLDRALKAV